MFGNGNKEIEISRRPAITTGATFSDNTNAGTVIYTSWYFYFQATGSTNTAYTTACTTDGIGDFTTAFTGGAGYFFFYLDNAAGARRISRGYSISCP